jgi:hypothetical protein
MDLSTVRDYKSWVGKSAEEILAAAKQVGGRAAVFPDRLPHWAHRVRNFFNEEPRSLTRFDAHVSHEYLAMIHVGLDALGSRSDIDEIAEKRGLSGDVYKDESGHTWYQMSPGATIYHWGKEPIWPFFEAIKQHGKQAIIPIFKLVSPDSTGGSSETIIKNPQNQLVRVMSFSAKLGRRSIGEVRKKETVIHLIVRDEWHQGSYNYSETVIMGLAAHEKHDVRPHKKYPYPGVYVNPQDRFLPLALRRFPEYGAANERNPLAKQV